MIGTTIAVCDQCKSMKECIADVLSCRYICLDCQEHNTTKDVNKFYTWRHMTDLEQIRETLSKMQAQIDFLEDRMNSINPQCYWPSVTAASPECYETMSLSAARSCWPMLEHEFDEYCMKNKLTQWTKADSLDFYNKYVGLRSRFWVDDISMI